MKTTRRSWKREHWKTWVRRDLVHLGYWPQFTEKQRDWVKFDARAIVRQLVEGRIDVLHWGLPENWYPVDAGCSRRHPALAALDDDPYERVVEECHRHGIRVLLWSATNACVEGVREHFREELGTASGVQRGHASRLCLADARFTRPLFAATRALLRRYAVDGLLVDGPWPEIAVDEETGRFRCAHCRESYRRFSGRVVAPREDWNDPAWRRYVRWRYRYTADFVRAFYRSIKALDPRLFVGLNNLTTPAGTWRDKTDPNLALGLTDSAVFESTLHGGHLLETTMKSKFGAAMADGNPVGITLKTSDLNPGGLAEAKPSFVDVATLGYSALMHGGWVDFHSTTDQYACPQPLRTRVYQEVGRDIAAKRRWIENSVPVPHVGIVYSVKTRDFYSGASIPNFMHAFLGAERLLVESHVSTGCLLDRQIAARHLDRFACVVLPNVACMTDAEIAEIRSYVHRGGGLIVTGETSLYDGNERFRGEFGLRDVLGASFRGIDERARKVHTGRAPFNWKKAAFRLHRHEITARLGKQDTDLTWLPWFRVGADAGREVVGTWLDIEEDTLWPVNTGRFITGDSGEPCLVAGQYGKGRVVYASPDLTGFYVTRSQRFVRELFTRMVDWVAPIPVRAIAPKAVEMSVLRQRGRRALVVHLLNATTGNKGYDNMLAHGGWFDARGNYRPYSPRTPMRSTPRKDMDAETAALAQQWRVRAGIMEMPVCDENIPVRGVKLMVDRRVHPRIRGARLVPEGKALRMDRVGGHFVIAVPEVRIHQMVVLDLGRTRASEMLSKRLHKTARRRRLVP